MFVSRNATHGPRERRSAWLIIVAAVSLTVAGVILASLTVGPASASQDGSAANEPHAPAALGEPAALPNAGGAHGGEATNMAFVLAAAALAVGTVLFVGSAKKGVPEGSKVEASEPASEESSN
jgi:hypothetical protein